MIIIGFAILGGGVALSIWVGQGTWRLRSRILRSSITVLTCVLAAVCAAAFVFALTGLGKLRGRDAPVPDVKVAGTPAQLERGATIARAYCSDCHSATGPLTGDLQMGKSFPVPVGSFVSGNLTPAGVLSGWSDGEIFRAIRNSIDAQGHWLIIMSYTDASRLSDADVLSVIAYLRSLVAAGRPTPSPPDRLNLLGLLLLGSGQLSAGNAVFTGTITSPPPAVSAAYGKYLVACQGCGICHGGDLPGAVPALRGLLGPDLTPVKAWKREEFIATLRTGIDPDGHVIDPRMPWRAIGSMSDTELGAIYEYLAQPAAPEAGPQR